MRQSGEEVRKCSRVGRKLENVAEWGGSQKMWEIMEEVKNVCDLGGSQKVGVISGKARKWGRLGKEGV